MQDVDEPKEAGQGSGKMPSEQSKNVNIAASKEVFLRCSDISAHECDPAVPVVSSVRLRLTCFGRSRKDPLHRRLRGLPGTVQARGIRYQGPRQRRSDISEQI